MLIGLKDRVLLEQAYRQVSGDNLISEELVGNTGFVYHRTDAYPAESEIWKTGVDNKKNKRGMYGPGLYCTYKLESQMGENMVRNYGKYIIRGKVNLSNFFIFSKSLFIKIRKGQNYLDQYKKHNLLPKPSEDQKNPRLGSFPYGAIQELLKKQEKDPDDNDFYSSDLAYLSFRKLIRENKVSGLEFRGRNDGYVAVVYEKSAFIPHSYSEDNGKTWISMKPNIANMVNGEPVDLIANIHNFYVKSSIPRLTFKRILAEYEQNKKLSDTSTRSFLKYSIIVSMGGDRKGLTENQYEILKNRSVNINVSQHQHQFTSIQFSNYVTNILPVKFTHITCGVYYPPHNVNNLINSPNRIKGSMDINHNLDSLKGCPYDISGNFTLRGVSNITTLENGPYTVLGNYYCSNLNNLQSLNGLAHRIGKQIIIERCPKLEDVTALFKTIFPLKSRYFSYDYPYDYPVYIGGGWYPRIDYDIKSKLKQKGLIAPNSFS